MNLFEFVELYLKKKRTLKDINYALINRQTPLFVNRKVLEKLKEYKYVDEYNIELNIDSVNIVIEISFLRDGGLYRDIIPFELYI